MFEFQWAWMFILLLLPVVLPFLLPLLFKSWIGHGDTPNEKGVQQDEALLVPFLDELEDGKTKNKNRAQQSIKASTEAQGILLRQVLLFIAWLLLVAAIAKPVWVDDVGNVPVSSRNIVIAVDLSGSMAQRDFRLLGSRITRLAATKKVASNFIEQRVGDRVGLILFADQAYLQAPLTRDRQTVIKLLNEAELGLAGERTALGDAIGLAVKKIPQGVNRHVKEGMHDKEETRDEEEYVLVIMTDGAATVGVNVDEAIRFAVNSKLKVYTVGIGSLASSSTKTNGTNQGSDLDETTLKKIADKTGGYYFRAKSIDELESIYQELDKLEPVIDITQTLRPAKDLFYWPLALSCLTLLLLGLLNGFRVSFWRNTNSVNSTSAGNQGLQSELQGEGNV